MRSEFGGRRKRVRVADFIRRAGVDARRRRSGFRRSAAPPAARPGRLGAERRHRRRRALRDARRPPPVKIADSETTPIGSETADLATARPSLPSGRSSARNEQPPSAPGEGTAARLSRGGESRAVVACFARMKGLAVITPRTNPLARRRSLAAAEEGAADVPGLASEPKAFCRARGEVDRGAASGVSRGSRGSRGSRVSIPSPCFSVPSPFPPRVSVFAHRSRRSRGPRGSPSARTSRARRLARLRSEAPSSFFSASSPPRASLFCFRAPSRFAALVSAIWRARAATLTGLPQSCRYPAAPLSVPFLVPATTKTEALVSRWNASWSPARSTYVRHVSPRRFSIAADSCTMSTSGATRGRRPSRRASAFVGSGAFSRSHPAAGRLLAPPPGRGPLRCAPLHSTLEGLGCVLKWYPSARTITSSIPHAAVVSASRGRGSSAATKVRRKKSRYVASSPGLRNAGGATGGLASRHASRVARSRDTTLVYAPRSKAGALAGLCFFLPRSTTSVSIASPRLDIARSASPRHVRDSNRSSAYR